MTSATTYPPVTSARRPNGPRSPFGNDIPVWNSRAAASASAPSPKRARSASAPCPSTAVTDRPRSPIAAHHADAPTRTAIRRRPGCPASTDPATAHATTTRPFATGKTIAADEPARSTRAVTTIAAVATTAPARIGRVRSLTRGVGGDSRATVFVTIVIPISRST